MDALEFKEFIFGMLFLKRLSDEFDLKRKHLREVEYKHYADDPEALAEIMEDKTSYGETFFVPIRARWNESWLDQRGDLVPAIKDLKSDIGAMLNKAIAAIEDENDALDGVLKNNIDFNEIKGKTKIADSKWKDLLDHFNQPGFQLVNDNFEFPDLLGAAYFLSELRPRQRQSPQPLPRMVSRDRQEGRSHVCATHVGQSQA